MRIGEVAEHTGLSISNIRFYEKKGLLKPVRDPQSSYREYTEDDVCRLKQILLYRKMDLPIELVREILEEDAPLNPILDNQIAELKKKKEILQASIDLCEEVLKNDISTEADIDYYLNYVKKEEATGRRFAEIEEFITDFASCTEFDRWAADPVIYRFFKNSKIMKVARIIWTVVLLVIPIILIIDGCLDADGFPIGNIVSCIFIILIIWGAFVHFRMNKT